jgi:hypothetical protein
MFYAPYFEFLTPPLVTAQFGTARHFEVFTEPRR